MNTTGRAINSTAIIFEWQHPPPAGRNGNITGYSLIVTELITNTTTTYSQSGARIELVVSSLHPYYEYECAIAAETSVGRGPYGTAFIIRTLTDGNTRMPVAIVLVYSRISLLCSAQRSSTECGSGSCDIQKHPSDVGASSRRPAEWNHPALHDHGDGAADPKQSLPEHHLHLHHCPQPPPSVQPLHRSGSSDYKCGALQ